MTADEPTVLVVEDEDPLRETYAQILTHSYEIIATATGKAAIDALSPEIDIVLLDRRLTDMTGSEVLRELQARNYNCYVAMVTAVDPDFDIIELGIDDYLVKPASASDIEQTVERLLSLAEYDSTRQELSQKRVTKSVLSQEKGTAELRQSEKFKRLCADIDRLEAELDDMAETLDAPKHRLNQ